MPFSVDAFLEFPISQEMIDNYFSPGASHVILSDQEGDVESISGIENALSDPDIDIRIFGKLTTRKYRRMGVALGPTLDKVKEAASKM